MLNPPLSERIWFYPVDTVRNVAKFEAMDSKFSLDIPLHPFLGCIGVAPAGGEARSSIVPAENGGNMDAPEASAGHTLYLPVNVPGALLYMGDGHAAMGDGEVAGTGIEIPMRVRVQVNVIKGKAIRWPRFENEEYIMAVGAYRPLDDALLTSRQGAATTLADGVEHHEIADRGWHAQAAGDSPRVRERLREPLAALERPHNRRAPVTLAAH